MSFYKLLLLLNKNIFRLSFINKTDVMSVIMSIICLNSASVADDDYDGHFWVPEAHLCCLNSAVVERDGSRLHMGHPQPKALLPGTPPNPCPNPHVYEVNTLITAFSSHHLDHSPFALRGCHFGHILQQFFGVIEVALFLLITEYSGRFSSDGSCGFMFGWYKLDIVKTKPP